MSPHLPPGADRLTRPQPGEPTGTFSWTRVSHRAASAPAESENQRRCLRRPEEERNNEAQDTLSGGLRERGSSTRAGAGRLGDGTRRLCREVDAAFRSTHPDLPSVLSVVGNTGRGTGAQAQNPGNARPRSPSLRISPPESIR
ncbi:hypothetical protein THAOC_21172, partial [Thalassiosira oceanica]